MQKFTLAKVGKNFQQTQECFSLKGLGSKKQAPVKAGYLIRVMSCYGRLNSFIKSDILKIPMNVLYRPLNLTKAQFKNIIVESCNKIF